jgi:hypothetical protein
MERQKFTVTYYFRTNRAAFLSGALPFVLFFSGCTTRSISNSDSYGGRGYYYGHGPQIGGYQGELSEFDVLGVDRRGQITDADIASTLATVNTAARLTRASRILLIQSGADFPDAAMHEAMQQHFHVASFPGKPVRPPAQSETARNTGAGPERASYSKSLRLTAAQGGYDKIVCYWGQLESAEVDQATKIISWIPIIG